MKLHSKKLIVLRYLFIFKHFDLSIYFDMLMANFNYSDTSWNRAWAPGLRPASTSFSTSASPSNSSSLTNDNHEFHTAGDGECCVCVCVSICVLCTYMCMYVCMYTCLYGYFYLFINLIICLLISPSISLPLYPFIYWYLLTFFYL